MTKMQRIYSEEMRKIARCNTFKLYNIVRPTEIENERKKLKLANVNYRTEPIIRRGMIVGYKIFIKE